MREVKFRGKQDGEWVYGIPLTNPRGQTFICQDMRKGWEVTPDTVGQYTGLKDKNGKEIYEGDVVTACWYDYEEPNHDMTGVVEFTQGWMAYWIADYENKEFSEINGCGYYSWTIEVIGNIYENPELLTN